MTSNSSDAVPDRLGHLVVNLDQFFLVIEGMCILCKYPYINKIILTSLKSTGVKYTYL